MKAFSFNYSRHNFPLISFSFYINLILALNTEHVTTLVSLTFSNHLPTHIFPSLSQAQSPVFSSLPLSLKHNCYTITFPLFPSTATFHSPPSMHSLSSLSHLPFLSPLSLSNLIARSTVLSLSLSILTTLHFSRDTDHHRLLPVIYTSTTATLLLLTSLCKKGLGFFLPHLLILLSSYPRPYLHVSFCLLSICEQPLLFSSICPDIFCTIWSNVNPVV